MTQVTLHVYDIAFSPANSSIGNAIPKINRFAKDRIGLGGLFHSAIEIEGFNHEFSFGMYSSGYSSVYSNPPGSNPNYTWREYLVLGVTCLSRIEIIDILQGLCEDWNGSYNLLQRNCNHFCDELCIKLGTKRIPAWVNRFANIGISIVNPFLLMTESLHVLGQTALRCYFAASTAGHDDFNPSNQLQGNNKPANINSFASNFDSGSVAERNASPSAAPEPMYNNWEQGGRSTGSNSGHSVEYSFASSSIVEAAISDDYDDNESWIVREVNQSCCFPLMLCFPCRSPPRRRHSPQRPHRVAGVGNKRAPPLTKLLTSVVACAFFRFQGRENQ